MAKNKGKSKKCKKHPGPAIPNPKSVNPFSLHFNKKRKFPVIGQSQKGTKGNPGVSRQRAVDIRSKTLLVEYVTRNKSNMFIDRRLGENDCNADEGTKMDLRKVEEARKGLTKQSLYNLTDVDDILLTHNGVPLDDDNMHLAPSDVEDDLDDDGMLDAKFVKDQHFGGMDDSDPDKCDTEGPSTKYKSAKDRIDEIVAESKQRKLQLKQEKEFQRDRVSKLDLQFASFMQMMSGHLMTEDDKLKTKKEDPMRDFDCLMRSISIDGGVRARPTERIKSPEEVAREEQQKQTLMEKERLKRMKPDYEEDGPKAVVRSADALDEGIVTQFNAMPTLQYKDGRMVLLDESGQPVTTAVTTVTQRLSKNERRKLKKMLREEKRKKEEEKRLKEEMGDTDEDVEDKEESDAEDNYSDILEDDEEESEQKDTTGEGGNCEESEDEITAKHTDNEENNNVKQSYKKCSKTKKKVSFFDENEGIGDNVINKKSSEAKQKAKYSCEVPREFDAFWELLQERSPSEVFALLSRMVEDNHPRLQHSNKIKCADVFSHVLQLLNVICNPKFADSPCPHKYTALSYWEPLVPLLRTLTELDSGMAGKAMFLVYIEKRDEYRHQHTRLYPYLDTIVFLHMAGLLFPASDFRHPVMTPIKTFLQQLLGEARMKDGRGVVAGLYCAVLLIDHIRESGQYIPELAIRLMGLVLRCVPPGRLAEGEEEQKRLERQDRAPCGLPLHWLLHKTLPSHDMLLVRSQTKIPSFTKFSISMLNNDSLTMTDGLRSTVLFTAMSLLTELCTVWALLPAIRTVMRPLKLLLKLLPIHLYPDQVINLKEQLEAAITSLPPQQPKLTVDKGRPKPLRMLEPLVQKVKVTSTPRSTTDRTEQKAREKKLFHYLKRERKAASREIRKDTAFLARKKLKETLASDAERKRKVNLIMNDLRAQEGEHKRYQSMKPGQR